MPTRPLGACVGGTSSLAADLVLVLETAGPSIDAANHPDHPTPDHRERLWDRA